jgi:hypothetical protein
MCNRIRSEWTQYVAGSDLRRVIGESGVLPEVEALHLAADIAAGLGWRTATASETSSTGRLAQASHRAVSSASTVARAGLARAAGTLS